MRTKQVVERKIEKIESYLRSMNFFIGRNQRTESYDTLDKISEEISNIRTLLNTEEQD